jgi:hypothetical protein
VALAAKALAEVRFMLYLAILSATQTKLLRVEVISVNVETETTCK